MNPYFFRKKIFAISFLSVITGFSALSWMKSGREVLDELFAKKEAAKIESIINDQIPYRYGFIESYGLVQNLLGKDEFNNYKYVRDKAGYIHYSGFYMPNDSDIEEYALRIRRLQECAEAKGTEVLYVVPPAKYNPKYNSVGLGTPVNDPQNVVEQFLYYLKRLDIETINLGEYLPNADLPYEECFFKTDHHWTFPAAMEATKIVKEKIDTLLGENLDPENIYLSEQSYTAETFTGAMLGSMGRGTGIHFGGIDDFTAYFPTFDQTYSRRMSLADGEEKKSSGSFEEVVMDMDVFKENKDLYTSSSAYSLYLDEISDLEHLVNLSNPDGKKMLMVRDSYFGPVMAFLSPLFSEIDSVWCLTERNDIDIESMVKENDYDIISIETYPYNINNDAFNYFQSEGMEGEHE